MTVNELKYVYIEETMSALGNEELMEAILDAVRKVKVKFQERQEDVLPRARKSFKS